MARAQDVDTGTFIPMREGDFYRDSNWGGPAYGGNGGQVGPGGLRLPGTSAYDQDIARYRGLATRSYAPVELDRGQEGESRFYQVGSLAGLGAAARGETEDMRLLGSAARGDAPSRAEILGRQMSDRALRAQNSAAGSIRGGPGATAAAYRFAAQNAAQQRAEMNQGIQAERAAEMATARGQYSGALGQARGTHFNAAAGLRGQDIDLAGKNAELDLRERMRRDQVEQAFEGMASDTRFKNLDAEQNAYFGEMRNDLDTRRTDLSEQQQDWDRTKDYISLGTGAISGAAGVAGRACGGPVRHARPYLVGEEGPELVIPKHDATVVPAKPTAHIMGSLAHYAVPRAHGGPMVAGGAPDAGALPLYEPPGQRLQQTPEGHAFYASDVPASDGRPSLSASFPSKAPTYRPAAAARATPPQARRPTPEELMAMANAMGEQQRSDHMARMAAGPAIRGGR